MRIFTSWSGDRSKAAALGLRSLLQEVIGEDAQIFVSEDQISPGEAWANRLGNELEQSDFGIICLTRDNWQSPWLLFEAGAIAKKFATSRVVPYLIDELPPDYDRSPLKQFQHVRASHDGTYRLIEAINKSRETPKPADRLERSFEKWWPDLEQTLKAFQVSDSAQPPVRSERELLEILTQKVESLYRITVGIDLPVAEVAHLRNLRDNPELVYKRDANLQKELRHLRDSGFIKNRKPIADLPANFSIGQHFDLMDKGRDYLQKNVSE